MDKLRYEIGMENAILNINCCEADLENAKARQTIRTLKVQNIVLTEQIKQMTEDANEKERKEKAKRNQTVESLLRKANKAILDQDSAVRKERHKLLKEIGKFDENIAVLESRRDELTSTMSEPLPPFRRGDIKHHTELQEKVEKMKKRVQEMKEKLNSKSSMFKSDFQDILSQEPIKKKH